MIGTCTGICAAIACAAAWVTIFADRLAGKTNAKLILQVVLTAAAVAGPYWMFMQVHPNHVFSMLVILVAVGIILVEVALHVMPENRNPLPFFAGAYALFTAAPLGLFMLTACDLRMHPRPYGTSAELARFHVLFSLLCVALAIVLRCRLSAQTHPASRVSAIGSLIFLACISVAFFGTIPPGGDEISSQQLHIIPAFLVAAAAVLITSMAVLIGSRCPMNNCSWGSRVLGLILPKPKDGSERTINEPHRSGAMSLVPGFAGVVTWLACISVTGASMVQTVDGAILPWRIVVFQLISWIIAIPWLWLLWLLRPVFNALGKGGAVFILNFYGILWGLAVYWGLSHYLGRYGRSEARAVRKGRSGTDCGACER